MARIYILANKAMPGLVKIGFTDGEAHDRAVELQSTGVPLPFTVVRSWSVFDAHLAEQTIHKRLAKYRVEKNREFFRLLPEHAIRLITEVVGAPNYSPFAAERCAFVNCADAGVVTFVGRHFCPRCSARVRKAIRGAPDKFRLAYLSTNLKPIKLLE